MSGSNNPSNATGATSWTGQRQGVGPQISGTTLPGQGGEIPQQQPNDRLALNAPRRNGLFG